MHRQPGDQALYSLLPNQNVQERERDWCEDRPLTCQIRRGHRFQVHLRQPRDKKLRSAVAERGKVVDSEQQEDRVASEVKLQW